MDADTDTKGRRILSYRGANLSEPVALAAWFERARSAAKADLLSRMQKQLLRSERAALDVELKISQEDAVKRFQEAVELIQGPNTSSFMLHRYLYLHLCVRCACNERGAWIVGALVSSDRQARYTARTRSSVSTCRNMQVSRADKDAIRRFLIWMHAQPRFWVDLTARIEKGWCVRRYCGSGH